MDFTREPIVETVITPKEGCKLVIRSSKSNGQEEHFVDAVEVVSFGHSFFFRSLERPKTFLVPATDYEILEVREARMVLKNVGIERSIKIGGGREGHMRTQRETQGEKPPAVEEGIPESSQALTDKQQEPKTEARIEKKRDRRRNYRRRRGRESTQIEDQAHEGETLSCRVELPEPSQGAEVENGSLAQQVITTSILTSLLPPPPKLISETIKEEGYRERFEKAFYTKGEGTTEEECEIVQENKEPKVPLEQPQYGPYDLSIQEEEEIYRQRKEQVNNPLIEDQDFPPTQEDIPTQKHHDEESQNA